MRLPKNEFTEQMSILLIITIAALVASALGGWQGFVIGLVISIPMAVGALRWIGLTPKMDE